MVKRVTQRRSWRSNTKSSRELLRTRLLATYSNRKPPDNPKQERKTKKKLKIFGLLGWVAGARRREFAARQEQSRG